MAASKDALRQTGMGVLASFAAFAGGLLLVDAVGGATLPLFFAAVVICTWYGGSTAAMVCTALSLPMIVFLAPPRYQFALAHDEDWVRVGLVCLVSGVIITLDHIRRHSQENERGSLLALEENQERLRVALEAGGMGTFQWDILKQELTWSPGVEVLHGVEGGITSGSVLLLMEAIHPDDRERFQLTITKSLRSGAPDLDADYRVLLPNGDVRWMTIKGRVKHEKSGLPSMISGVVWDTTERKEHENVLRESEERFRLLADSSPVLIWMNDLEGCEFVNREYLDYVGKPLKDALGMRWADAVHPEDYEEYVGGYAEAVEKQDVFESQVRLLGADGEYRWFKSVGIPRLSAGGELLGYIGSSFDVNDLKVAQEQVQESEERFRTMADSAPALIWMADMENRGTWFNKEWVEFTGRTLEEELGFGWTAGVHPDDLDQAVETCNAAFDAREEFKMEFRLRRRDGEYRWVLDHGVPRYGPDGQFQGYIGSCIDIHERKREDEYRDLLLRAGAALGSSLDYRQTLQQVVEIVVSGGGDIASIDLANDEGSVTRVAVAHAEGGMTDVLRQTLGSSEPMDPVKRALVTGQTQFLPNLDDESILKVTQGDAELLKLARMMHPSALLCVPMTWRGDVLGVFNVAMVNGRQFGSAEINLCQQLAARISGAVENAQLYEETRRAQDRQQFLVDAGTQLAATLDLEEALALVANLPVPELGDLCVVQLIGDDGSPGRVVPAAADPELAKKLAEFAANYPDEARPEGLRIRAITERKTMFYPQVGDELIRGLTQSEPKRELLRRLRANSIVAVPLMAHNEPIGALTLAVTASSGRRYKQADALAAEAFAQRAALALLNARLYTRAQETQEVLRQLNVAKDEFVGMVSHELRTPITTVFSGARFLRSRADNLDDQTAREVLADIEQEAARLELIVENLLALARQEAGKEPEMGPLPINRVVKGVVSRMQNLRPSRPFQLTPADDPQLASGVPIYLELVLRNLLDNADKYSPAGKPVEITSRCVTGTVNVHVRDHGPGLNEADAEKVFEQFYRSGASNGVSGTGVGLAVCQRLMESQGGTISLSNHKDGGLEACLTLPVFREDIGQ